MQIYIFKKTWDTRILFETTRLFKSSHSSFIFKHKFSLQYMQVQIHCMYKFSSHQLLHFLLSSLGETTCWSKLHKSLISSYILSLLCTSSVQSSHWGESWSWSVVGLKGFNIYSFSDRGGPVTQRQWRKKVWNGSLRTCAKHFLLQVPMLGTVKVTWKVNLMLIIILWRKPMEFLSWCALYFIISNMFYCLISCSTSPKASFA